MDLSLMDKEKADKAVSRKRRQQSVAAGFSRFAELEQAVQEIRSNALQVLKTPYYRNCKAARNIRRVGMRVIRELCKQMRSETVTIGKERKKRRDGSIAASMRRKLGGPAEPAVVHPLIPSASVSGIDLAVGSSPSGVNFFCFMDNNNPPAVTELTDTP
ncbi:uncharacterized protein [Physcomitrium patens]|uniref:Uncharacterized protein n=1 Tax=Physcomitrium patens TaxID=3218 RepID=A0A7I4FKY9_PHYPA